MEPLNNVNTKECPKVTTDEFAEELQGAADPHNKYGRVQRAVRLARRFFAFDDESASLESLLVNSNTAIGSVFRRDTLPSRVVFFAMYILMLAFSIYMSFLVAKAYFAREAVYKLTVIQPENLTMPAITICNKNPLRKAPLCAQQGVLAQRWNLTSNEQKNLELFCQPGRSHLTPLNYRQVIPQLAQHDTLHEFGHNIVDFLRTCQIKSVQCYPMYFTESIDIEAGRCWCLFCNHSFDVHHNIAHLKVFEYSVYREGLVLLLDTEPEQHFDDASDGDGFLLKVHEPGTAPHPLFGSINLPVNQTTYTAIRTKEIIREPGFLPDMCISDYPESMDYVDRREKYHPQSCMEACQQQIIVEVCGCFVVDLYNLTKDMGKACPAFAPDAVDPKLTCNPEELAKDPKKRRKYDVNQCGYNCYTAMQSHPSKHFGRCADLCRPSCYETIHHTTISRARWLQTLSKTYFPRYLIRHKTSEMVRVCIFFEKIEKEVLTATPKMTYVMAFIEVGAQIGMYLGLTALTLFEACELIIRYLFIVYNRYRNGVSVRTREASLPTSDQTFLHLSMKMSKIQRSQLEKERNSLSNRMLSAS